MKEKKDNSKLVIIVLVSVVIFLALVVVYAFVIQPAINGLMIQAYNEGAQTAIIQIAQQSSTCQQVPLIIGNQTVNLVDVRCLG